MNNTEVVSNWNFARNFPELGTDLVARPHLIDTIAEILTAETPVVFLEGEAGDGATTTLAQFCTHFPDACFSLFIRPASRFAYSADYLRLVLAEQIHWYVHETTLNREAIQANEMQALVMRMRGKQRSKKLYFVVDGLHQVPPDGQDAVAEIFSGVLPLGIDNCRFIITGQQSQFQPLISGIKSKPYRQLKFSQDESRQFLAGLSLSEADCARIYKVCRSGVPGRLAAVKRLLTAGKSLDEILNADPRKYLEFLNLEFAPIEGMSESQRLVVSLIAFSKMPITLPMSAQMTMQSESEIKGVVNQCPFLLVSPSTQQIDFISQSHTKCAEKALENHRKDALSLQLNFLLQNPRSDIALRFLPSYLETLQQEQSILDLLTPEHYADLFTSSSSIAALRSRTEVGVRAAQTLKKFTEIFKFAVQKAIFSSTSVADGSEAQIEALIALGRTDIALALASGAIAKEDRLALLAAYARRVKEQGRDIDSPLLAIIKDLLAQIDFSELGDKAIKIAANILIFDPDAAITIIDSAVKGASQVTRDTALIELSLNATFSKLSHRTQFEDKARPQISDTALQLVARSFAALADRFNVDELIVDLERMPIENRIYFLRSFIGMRKSDHKVLDLVEYGLDAIIKEAAYTPRVADLADMAVPFSTAIDDRVRLQRLVARFESQMGLAAKTGQSKELTRLQMRLAAAERQYDKALCRDRIERAILEALDIRTPEVQVECYSILLRALHQVDPNDEFELVDGFKALVKSELTDALSALLKDTGEQFVATSAAISVLAAHNAVDAIALAASLNTEARRNKAFALIAGVLASKRYADEIRTCLHDVLTRITNIESRAAATIALLDHLDSNRNKEGWIHCLEEFRVHLVHPSQFASWDVWLLLVAQGPEDILRRQTLLKRLEEHLPSIESPLERIELSFQVTQALAVNDSALARNYYDQAVSLKQTLVFGSERLAKMLELCIGLIARSMATLARSDLLDEDKWQRFDHLVLELPSLIQRARAYCDLAEQLWCGRKIDLAHRVIQQKIQPLITAAASYSRSTKSEVVAIAWPALSIWHQATALDYLSELSEDQVDSALFEASMMRLRKLPTATAHFDGKLDPSKLEIHEVVDIIEFIGRAPNDALLYAILRSLVDVVSDKRNRLRFTIQQRADWATKCRTIVEQKLPDSRNIVHEGYKVVCLALTYRMDEGTFAQWSELVERTSKIANVADQSYVYLAIASCLSRYNDLRDECLRRAHDCAQAVPSQLDRISHLQDYAEEAYSRDSSTSARESVRQALQLSLELENNARASRHRRELIDLADKMDPKFADELIDQIDDDPARRLLKAEAKRASALAKSKRELANARSPADVEKCDVAILPEAAWRNLAALESGQLMPKPIDVISEYVTKAAEGSLFDAFPTLAFYLSNLDRKFRSTQDIRQHVLPICEALMLSTEMPRTIVSQTSKRQEEPRLEASSGGMFVRRNGRQGALDYISSWLRANAVDFVKYCDTYFSTKDIALLKLVLAQAPACKIFVVASKRHLEHEQQLSAEVFKSAWKDESVEDPPETEIVAVGYSDSKSHVVHDRWLVTRDAALRLGTSFNSLGNERVSEISEMEPARVPAINAMLDRFINRVRLIDDVRMQYVTFTLD